ncbi:MAG TPA: hypothetical protein VF927_11630 [Solirubrobacteraceae bacterium]
MRILGLALAAVFALFAMSAVSASAAAPEWGACEKIEPKNTGNFSDKLCSVASEPGKGKYELAVGSIGKGKGLKIKGVGNQVLHNVVPEKGDIFVTCQKLKGSGAPVAPAGEKEVKLTFKKCSVLEETVECKNVSKSTIETNALKGSLAEVEGKIGTILEPEAGEFFVTFECPGVFPKVRVKGSVFGEYTGNDNTISKVGFGHYTVGPFLGEPFPGYTPLVNHPTAGPPNFGVLHTEAKNKETEEKYTTPENPEGWGPPGGLPSGQQGEVEVKGEALMIHH